MQIECYDSNSHERRRMGSNLPYLHKVLGEAVGGGSAVPAGIGGVRIGGQLRRQPIVMHRSVRLSRERIL